MPGSQARARIRANPYRRYVADTTKNPEDIPNGAGEGSTSDNAPDATSGGSPEQPDSAPNKEDPDGTPKENPAG